MKLFVTGGTGFVGSNFINLAIERGHQIVALRRPGSQPRVPIFTDPTWIEGGLDGDYMVSLMGCDVMVHFASHTPNVPYAPLYECLYWNVYASVRLAHQAAQAGIGKFVIIGSYFEYGDGSASGGILSPGQPLAPVFSYPISKAAASIAFEGFAREARVRLKILRLFQVYGPGEVESRLWPSLRRAALEGRDFHLSPGEQVRDFIHVDEVVEKILNHLDCEKAELGVPQVFHVASGKPQTLRQFAETAWSEWNAQGKLVFGAIPYREGEAMKLVSDSSVLA